MISQHDIQKLDAVAFRKNGKFEPVSKFIDGFGASRLPTSHINFLTARNGISVYNGMYRMFGTDTVSIDLKNWNSYETWKFAWETDVSQYFCFAETAWGDQYAYRVDELASPENAIVYFLEHATMSVVCKFADFEDFFHNEFIRNAYHPFSQIDIDIIDRFGSIDTNDHFVFSPSILLSKDEDVANVLKMSAVSSMIVNGDLSRQLSATTTDQSISRIEPYADDKGRTRMRVIFGD